MRKANLIGFAIFLITVGQAVSNGAYLPVSNTQIVPEHPTSCDFVVITLSGGWGSSCTPNASAISVVGNDIYFDVIWNYPPRIMCLTVITPWAQTQSVGPLSPETYKVYARLIGGPYVPPIYTLMTEFTVTDYQFVLSTDSLTVPEGQTATFTVRLLKDPCEAVLVTIARKSGDPDITIQSGGLLTFDSSNYSVPQTVTLAAAEDEDYLNGQVIIQISALGYLTDEVIAVEGDNDIPSVLYVDADANGNNDGRNWMDAFIDLQEALNVAEQYPEVEEIRVAQGVYRPAGPSGARYAAFQLINGLAIKGGYAGFGEPDPDARNISSYKTILSGDLNGNDGPNFTNRGDNSSNVVVGSGADSTSVLDGFTITAGDGAVGGGGMICYDGDPIIKNCTFRGNRAHYGGGIRCYNSNLTVTNCIFERNGSPGGRIDDGGAIFIQGSSISTLTNCTFVDNWTVETGGGLCCNHPSIAKVTNCIFWHNLDGSGMDESAQIHGGNLVINYSCIQGWTGVLGGNGNFGADPCFADPCDGDYHLKSQSGRWKRSIYIGLDPTGDGFIDLSDFAAFANYWQKQGSFLPADLDHSGIVDLSDLKLLLDNYMAHYHSGEWVSDDVTSPCIDAGDPNSDWKAELWPHGKRINMGACGGTPQASMSLSTAGNIADLDNDGDLDYNDVKLFTEKWLKQEVLLAADLDRSGEVNFTDFSIFGNEWYKENAEPGITYQISPCGGGLLAVEKLAQTRFTVTVNGHYIHFEDKMKANCCPAKLELAMEVYDNQIIIYEREFLTHPCLCICDYPVTADLGPFKPGTYTLGVYEDYGYGGFIGSTTVIIE